LVEADFLAFLVVAASLLTRAFLGVLVDFLVLVVAGLTVFVFVVGVRALVLGTARVVALATDFLAGVFAALAFALVVVTAFEAGFLEAGFVF
jgi:hypothetical protein